MITTATDLLAELRARNLVTPPDPALAESAEEPPATVERPWYIGLLLGVSGWFAGLFMLGFVALAFIPHTQGQAGVTGTVLLAAAFCLFKVDREGAFVSQLALALSIAGQCMVLYAFNKEAHGIAPVAATALVLQIVLAAVMPSRLHRTLSTFFASIAWALTIRFAFFGEPAFWGGESTLPASPGSAAGAWILTWGPVLGLTGWLVRAEAQWMARAWQPALRPVLTGLVVSLAFATLASQPFESFLWFSGGLALWPFLSALAALGGVAAGFALRSRALMGACALGMLAHTSHFYYALGTTLLVKSILMMAMGAAFWAAAHRLARKENA